MKDRVVVWFSCGASSAVAAKLAVDEFPKRVKLVYCDLLESEHEDNIRFLWDVEKWTERERDNDNPKQEIREH